MWEDVILNLRIDEILKEKGKTRYWLYIQLGLSYQNFKRILENQTKAIKFENLKLCGFMTMAPKCEQKEDYIKYFTQTYKLVLDIWTKKLHNIDRPIISMGMSDSYRVAIEEGSTLVRVGRRLFVK